MMLTVINILFTTYPEVLRCFVTITAIVAGITSTPLHLAIYIQRLSIRHHFSHIYQTISLHVLRITPPYALISVVIVGCAS